MSHRERIARFVDPDVVRAHVHGPLPLTDAQALVMDPAFNRTDRYGPAREAHAGYTPRGRPHPRRVPGRDRLGAVLQRRPGARPGPANPPPDGVLDTTRIPALADLQERKYLWRMP